MSFQPRMTAMIRGFRLLEARRSLSLDGMVADLWHVEGGAAAGGRYVSPDPRIVVMLDAARLALARGPGAAGPALGPVSYVPAGLALWGRVESPRRFRHLDLHFEAGRLAALAGGAGVPEGAILMAENARVETLARLLAGQCEAPDRPAAYAEALVAALVAELFNAPAAGAGGLSPERLARATAYLRRRPARRVSVAELAGVVGMAPSSFARAFKAATGLPPHRWHLGTRVARAGELLRAGERPVAVALETGFADQAHFTRAFRRVTGTTPAAWVREAGP